jgi:hypothetical protein
LAVYASDRRSTPLASTGTDLTLASSHRPGQRTVGYAWFVRADRTAGIAVGVPTHA